MAKMNPYLYFDGNAEEALRFYESAFGSKISRIHKMSDAPGTENMPEEERNRVMHISLPIDDHTTLMASDIMPSMGHVMNAGNNIHISLHPTSREEAGRLFNNLSAGGKIDTPLQDTFWGAYYGTFEDKYGINWMVNYDATSEETKSST